MFVEPFVFGFLLHGAATVGLVNWARWVARRHTGPWWQKQIRVPVIAFVFALVGAVIGFVLMWRAWNALEAAESEHKATRLAEGISLSLNWSALLIFAGWLLYAISLVICIVGSIRKPSPLPPMKVVGSGRD